MDKVNYKMLAILLGIALLFSLGGCYYYYSQAQQYQINQKDFTEYQKNKAEQQKKLNKLLQDNERMLRDITEITNLEKKLRRAIMRDVDTNKLNSDQNSADKTTTAPTAANSVGSGKTPVTGTVAINTLTKQNANISSMIAATKKSVSELLGELEGRSGTLASFPNKWPTEGGVISSSYGGRIDPIASGSEWHEGIDIAVDYGANVYASGAGTVEVAGVNGGYGQYVRIDHGNGYKTAYGHMSGIAASAGQRVSKGQIIGFAGSTGYSTGPHVHFEVIAEGQAIDPYYVLKK